MSWSSIHPIRVGGVCVGGRKSSIGHMGSLCQGRRSGPHLVRRRRGLVLGRVLGLGSQDVVPCLKLHRRQARHRQQRKGEQSKGDKGGRLHC